MSRYIDTLPDPDPETVTKPKFIVISASRTGTYGLWKAFKILGFKPYHMIEVMYAGGVPHMKMLKEAMLACQPCFADQRREAPVKRYGRAEFDKWFAGYDVIIEIPSYLGTDVVAAYRDDPGVKFLLTERDPGRWARSFTRSVGAMVGATHAWPLGVCKYLDATLYHFFAAVDVLWRVWADGHPPDAPEARGALQANYAAYLEAVKRATPPERLLTVRLEDGLGWEQICPFLGVPVPAEPYPRGNDPEEFAQIVQDHARPGVQKAIAGLTAIAVPVLGTSVWALMRYGPSMVRFARRSLRAD
ncbi:P-loop containing nucleoside triphosphate hydrolase protein [Xylariomycetidae sp. FL0641]|nr:P-loop containing nucleoside triphosphate hydrolase protein [Xylariomycetidae sp. FL0641]